jgi:AraC-like DNA-binding protein
MGACISAMKKSAPDQYPYHSGIFGKVLIDDLQAAGFSRAQIVGNTGIDLSGLDQNIPSVSFDVLAQLFERAALLTDDQLLGFKKGQKRELRRLGLIAFLGMSSPTIATFLENFARYRRVFSDAMHIDTSRLYTEGVTEWHFDVPRSIERRQFVEFGATGTIRELRQLAGRRLIPDAMEFRHQRSTGIKEIERYFGCSITFGSDENRLWLKRNDLDLPLKTGDDYLFKVIKQCCEDSLAKKKATKPSLVLAVENELARQLTRGGATQANIAKTLGMSKRTLSRRLAEQHVTFFQILESYRKALAESLIKDAKLPITEVAYLAGYKDASSFSTAFKRWTGQMPTEYRKARDTGRR